MTVLQNDVQMIFINVLLTTCMLVTSCKNDNSITNVHDTKSILNHNVN